MDHPPVLEYGTPSPLSPEDADFLRSLDRGVWRRSRDRFGHTHGFSSRALTAEEEARVLGLIAAHVLPCVLGSGPYGGLFFHVYDHVDAPGVDLPVLASFEEEHFSYFGHGPGFDRWTKRFEAVSAITHSERNRKVLAFYKLPEPAGADRYSY